MTTPRQLREKAAELDVQANELREAHRQSSQNSGSDDIGIGGFIGGMLFWGFVIMVLLNSCS